MTGSARWRWVALATILMIVLACAFTPTPASTPIVPSLTPATVTPDTAPAPTEAAPAPASAWDQVLDQIQPDGTVTAATALQAFALAFGPLPGVTVPDGPLSPIRSGSGALRWLVGHWEEITAEQRAEAVRLVPELAGAGAAPSAVRQPDRVAGATTSDVVATVRPPTYYAVLAQTMADEIEAQTHLHLDLTLIAHEGRTQKTTSLADTGVYNAQGGTTGAVARCVITISPTGAAQSGADLEDTLGHEVWHCYQGQIRGLAWYYAPPTPDWLIEGQAEWVGDALRPTAAAVGWEKYVLQPEKALFTRSYDAIGFYAHLMQAQINTWDVLIPMLQADDNNGARFEASGALADQFLDTWASSYFREPAMGPAWEMEGPGLPASRGPVRLVLAAAEGQTQPFSAPAYANRVYAVSASAEIIVFTVQGHVRLGDPGFKQEYVLSGGSFCTKPDGCTCPPGTTFAGPPPIHLSAESLLGVTGGPDGAQGTVAGYALKDFCHPPDGTPWSLVFWSPDLGDAAPPLLVAYTCDGLVSTWHALSLPGPSSLERGFELPFAANLVVHQDFHYAIPADQQSNAQQLDYALDFELVPTADPPVIIVTGTKTESEGGQSVVLAPREFGSDAPLELLNVSLETQLKPYPKYQHPFRAQALAECGQ